MTKYNKAFVFFEKHRETITYLFFGGLTTIVNIMLFMVLDLFTTAIWANTIAFFISVEFAYITNTKFVFKTCFTKQNFVRFWGMRIGTVLIDNFGILTLISMSCSNFLAKCIVNVVIIVLNYIFSKYIVYAKKGKRIV